MESAQIKGTRQSDTPLRGGEAMKEGVLIRPDGTVSFVGGCHWIRVATREDIGTGIHESGASGESSEERRARLVKTLTDRALAALPKDEDGWETFFNGAYLEEQRCFETSVRIDITHLDVGLDTPHPKWEVDVNCIPFPTESGSFEGNGNLFFKRGNGSECNLRLDESEAEGIENRKKWVEYLEAEVKANIRRSAGIDAEIDFGLFLFGSNAEGKEILIHPENQL